MTTSSIVFIVLIAVIALLLIATIAWVARNKRTQHRRVEAGDIRDKAADESHKVGQREALADETAAQARVGVADTLRAESYPNGVPNVPEFGSVKTQEGFEDSYAMDGLQHVRDGVAYPAVMLTAGMHAPRVTPWMPGKFAARLQAATSSGKPVLLRVEYENGHGMGAKF